MLRHRYVCHRVNEPHILEMITIKGYSTKYHYKNFLMFFMYLKAWYDTSGFNINLCTVVELAVSV